MCRNPREPDLNELERGAHGVVGNDWQSRLDRVFLENLGKFRKYDGKSVQDLMRALRNKVRHPYIPSPRIRGKILIGLVKTRNTTIRIFLTMLSDILDHYQTAFLVTSHDASRISSCMFTVSLRERICAMNQCSGRISTLQTRRPLALDLQALLSHFAAFRHPPLISLSITSRCRHAVACHALEIARRFLSHVNINVVPFLLLNLFIVC